MPTATIHEIWPAIHAQKVYGLEEGAGEDDG